MAGIALAAEVNKSLIHYHFGSKHNLWQEVKRRRLAELFESLGPLSTRDASGQDEFRTSMETFFRFLQSNPNYVRLSVWSNLEDPSLAEATRPERLRGLVDRFQEAQRRGYVRQDVHAKHIVVLYMNLCSDWFTAKNFYRRSGIIEGEDCKVDQDYLEDMMRIFFGGVFLR